MNQHLIFNENIKSYDLNNIIYLSLNNKRVYFQIYIFDDFA